MWAGGEFPVEIDAVEAVVRSHADDGVKEWHPILSKFLGRAANTLEFETVPPTDRRAFARGFLE